MGLGVSAVSFLRVDYSSLLSRKIVKTCNDVFQYTEDIKSESNDDNYCNFNVI